jgi:hypothetical protein
MDFKIVKKAGISVGEFGAMCGVSRVCASCWINGKNEPHRLHKAKIEKILANLRKLVAEGKLPLQTKQERLETLEEMVDVS